MTSQHVKNKNGVTLCHYTYYNELKVAPYIPPVIYISNTNSFIYKHLNLCQTNGRDFKIDIITRNKKLVT